MSFRPRYSLLTLLVLTAFVAGGVKLWYGPHRAVISDPPSAREQTLLARARWSNFWSERFDYEYVYRNGWAETEFLALVVSPREPYKLYIEEHSESQRNFLIATPHDPTVPPLKMPEKFHQANIVRIVYTGKSLRQPPAPPILQDGVPEIEDCYFLTADAEIYKLWCMWMFARVDHKHLSEIVDPIAQEMLQAELARLPSEGK